MVQSPDKGDRQAWRREGSRGIASFSLRHKIGMRGGFVDLVAWYRILSWELTYQRGELQVETVTLDGIGHGLFFHETARLRCWPSDQASQACHCQAQPSQITYPAESAVIVMPKWRGHLGPGHCTACCMFLFLLAGQLRASFLCPFSIHTLAFQGTWHGLLLQVLCHDASNSPQNRRAGQSHCLGRLFR